MLQTTGRDAITSRDVPPDSRAEPKLFFFNNVRLFRSITRAPACRAFSTSGLKYSLNSGAPLSGQLLRADIKNPIDHAFAPLPLIISVPRRCIDMTVPAGLIAFSSDVHLERFDPASLKLLAIFAQLWR